MGIVVAYILVLPLVQFCLTIGVGLTGIPIAFLLAWTSVRVRVRIAGVCGGVGGVLLAVAFGCAVFRVVLGPDSFTLGPFLASTLPLLIPIRNDWAKAQQVAAARAEWLAFLAQARPEAASTWAAETDRAAEIETAHGAAVAGEVFGLLLAAGWFFTR